MQLVALFLVYQKHCRIFAVIIVLTIKTMSYETFIHRL